MPAHPVGASHEGRATGRPGGRLGGQHEEQGQRSKVGHRAPPWGRGRGRLLRQKAGRGWRAPRHGLSTGSPAEMEELKGQADGTSPQAGPSAIITLRTRHAESQSL